MKLKFIFVGVAVLALAALGFVAFSFAQYNASRDYIEPEKTVVIASGTGARAIVKQLHEVGVIPPPWLIALPMMLGHDTTNLKAGEYAFTSGVSAHEVLQKIARGEVVVHKVTIPEGWNLRQIRQAFMNEPLLTDDFPAHVSEGSIFPETELFGRGESRADVVARLQKRMREALDDAWKNRANDLPFDTKEEALILASIVEKETGVKEERGRVAAVFVNRLRDGMLLQTDPTVVYGIEQQLGREIGRPLFKGDLQRDQAWNTYTRTGLPPTPICSPGLESIKAALNPPRSDEYYFVARGDGGHYFAKSLREHNDNVVKYKAKLKALAD